MNWQLNVDTDAVFSGNAKYDIAMAACFVGRTRHDKPGDWHEDSYYLNVPFDRVAAEAMDMREAQGDEEVVVMYEADTGPTISIPVTDQYPLGDVVRMLHSLPCRDEYSDGDDDVIEGCHPMQRQWRRRKRRRSRRTTRETTKARETARRGRLAARNMS